MIALQMCSKNMFELFSSRPKLYLYLFNDDNESYVFLGEKIIFRAPSFIDAVIAFLGLHYVCDMDYEDTAEASLHILLQYIIFKDKSTPACLLTQINAMWENYCQFKYKS